MNMIFFYHKPSWVSLLLLQKGGKETILEEELEFKGIEEEEEEENLTDTERNSAEGDKDKGMEGLQSYSFLKILDCFYVPFTHLIFTCISFVHYIIVHLKTHIFHYFCILSYHFQTIQFYSLITYSCHGIFRLFCVNLIVTGF